MSSAPIIDDLLQALEDGREGFLSAADSVRDPGLKTLFITYSRERAKMICDLCRSSPPKLDEDESVADHVPVRGWPHFETLLSLHDDFAILTECERGEAHAVGRYAEALKHDLPTMERSALTLQAEQIRCAHGRIRELCALAGDRLPPFSHQAARPRA